MYYIVLIQTHELGDSYDKGATQRGGLYNNNRLTMNDISNSQKGLCYKSYREQQQPRRWS